MLEQRPCPGGPMQRLDQDYHDTGRQEEPLACSLVVVWFSGKRQQYPRTAGGGLTAGILCGEADNATHSLEQDLEETQSPHFNSGCISLLLAGLPPN